MILLCERRSRPCPPSPATTDLARVAAGHNAGPACARAVQQAGQHAMVRRMFQPYDFDDIAVGRAPGNLLVDQSVSPPVPDRSTPAAAQRCNRPSASAAPLGLSPAASACRSARGSWPLPPCCWRPSPMAATRLYLRLHPHLRIRRARHRRHRDHLQPRRRLGGRDAGARGHAGRGRPGRGEHRRPRRQAQGRCASRRRSRASGPSARGCKAERRLSREQVDAPMQDANAPASRCARRRGGAEVRSRLRQARARRAKDAVRAHAWSTSASSRRRRPP